ncbi:MAG: efflux RND transporter periplasmic adaptor subunit, partial [Candidatus Sulfotelmatobacter sp.]
MTGLDRVVSCEGSDKDLRTSKECAVLQKYRSSLRLPGVLLLGLVILAGCSSKNTAPAPPPPSVTVAPVMQRDVSIHQEWVGTMAGNTDADIRPKVEGFLLKRLYMEGSFVQKGQVMFQLDRRQAQAALEQTKGQLEQARAFLSQAQIDVKRFTPLVAQKAVSQAELDKATSMERSGQAQVQAAQAAVDNANLNLGWTTVTSPISGIAGIAKVGIGDLMTPNTVMSTVSTVDPIYV